MTRSKLRKIRRQKSIRARTLLRGIPLASALLAGSGVVQAQQAEESQGLEEVVVTATRFPEKKLEHPIGVTVITREQIANSTAARFDEVRVSNIALTPAQVKRNFENCHNYGSTWYVSPTGAATNSGTRSPGPPRWSLTSCTSSSRRLHSTRS